MDGDGANKKRGTQRQLTKENYKDEETHAEDGSGSFERATEAELKTRQIRRVRRSTPTAATTGPNPFEGVSLVAPTPETKPVTEAEPQTDESPQEAAETAVPEEDVTKSENEDEEKPVETPSLFWPSVKIDATSGEATTAPAASASAPSFQPIDVKSGEEGEETVFSEKALLYTSVDGKWVAGGSGEVKINTDANGLARLIMRQDVTLHLILNARLYAAMKPLPMGENAVSFSCQNYVNKTEEAKNDGEWKLDTLIVALRFKVDAKTKVEKFMESVEKHKGGSQQSDI